jgi:hypothetical protein
VILNLPTREIAVRTLFRLITSSYLVFCLAGCATPVPLLEYSLARSAIESAKNVESVKYSPSHWHQASEYYRTATLLYKDGKYEEAKENFVLARAFAEKAENLTRLKRFKSGDAQ